DVWSQNFLDVTRHTYAEVTPSGEGCRIWGLTAEGSEPVHRKFTLEIDGKQIAAELFRRTPKVLTITGYRMDTVQELTNVDKAFMWAIVWGERRKAAAAEAAAKAAAATGANGSGFNAGPGYSIDEIERIVREGANGANRSDTFHAVVGHYRGCGWSIDRICEHLQQFPNGISDRYIHEGRLRREIERSACKYESRELPLSGGWTASPDTIVASPPAVPPAPAPNPANDDVPSAPSTAVPPDPEPSAASDDADLDEPDELDDDDLEDAPPQPSP